MSVAEPQFADAGPASGTNWDVVLPPEHAADWELMWPGDPAYARRDGDLSMRTELPLDGVATSWPQPDRPSLEDSRRLFINRQAESMIYFRENHRGHRYRSRHW